MNENEFTDEQLEEMTNPFAEALDTDGDGEVSDEEIEEGLNTLAELEGAKTEQLKEMATINPDTGARSVSELSALELVRQAERNTISDADKLKTALTETEIVEAKEKVDTTGKPTIEKLDALGLKKDRDRSHHCQMYADKNELHFLGFAISDGEPLFKERR